MNLRALALGVLLGFALAVSPSCGGGGSTCSADTCAGCCDESGKCQAGTGAQLCGTGGAACSACADGQACVDGACKAPAQACSEPCPNGCCDSTGKCQAGRDPALCGGGGEACTACASGVQCVARTDTRGGMCQGSGTSAVGTACTDNAECVQRLGQGGICKKNLSLRTDVAYPGGYCTLDCAPQTQVECPSGSTCVGGTDPYGEQDILCMDDCSTTDACRAGYKCYSLGGPAGTGICWLDPLPTPRNAPAGFTRKDCTPDGGECGNPPDNSFCFQQTLPDGGAAFPGGLCTAECLDLPEEFCGSDGVCLEVGQGNQSVAICFASCNSPGAGQGDVATGGCKPGYVCESLTVRLPDGGTSPSPTGYCFPSCDVTGCGTGQTCQAGYCK